MKSDIHSCPIFEESDLFELIYQGVDIDTVSSKIYVDNLVEFSQHSNITFLINKNFDLPTDLFDKQQQSNWAMPENYQNMDIEGFLVNVCPKENYERLITELQAFREKNMIDLLRWLKYFVDTCRKENIIWGVGRGSSVSSYVLFLLGVHKIDSIKYKLNFTEFMR